jgi:predicted  nucleic acid-binding Zn-ribbon protein
MDPGVIGALIPVVAIIAVAAVKIARVFAARPQAASSDVTSRLETLEHTVQSLQGELAETQERLDFAERLLTKARDQHRLGA